MRISFHCMLNFTKLMRVAVMKELDVFLTSNLNFYGLIDFVIKKKN